MRFQRSSLTATGGTSRRVLDRLPSSRNARKRRRGPLVESLETRTLLSIAASWVGDQVQFTGTGTADHLMIWETQINGESGFAYYDGTSTYTSVGGIDLTQTNVGSFTVDFSADPDSTLEIANTDNTPWTFAKTLALTGDGSTALQADAVDSSWALAQTGLPTPTLIGTVNNLSATGSAISFAGVANLAGDPFNTCILAGANVNSTWAFGDGAGSTAQTYTDDSSNSVTFSGFTTLVGGSGNDQFLVQGDGLSPSDVNANLVGGAGNNTFTLSNSMTLQGSIDGGVDAGTTTLNLSGVSGAIDVALTGVHATTSTYGFDGSATGVAGGFTNINGIIGNNDAGSLLQGLADDSQWTFDGTGSTYHTVTDPTYDLGLSGFTNLQGGAGIDTFDVSIATTLNLNGGAGLDAFNFLTDSASAASVNGEDGGATLSFSGNTSGVNVALTAFDTFNGAGFNGTANVLSVGFSNIDQLTGGSGTDSLQGLDVVSTWAISTSMTYTDNASHTLGFSAFETLQGGSDIDTFNVDVAASSVSLLGGAGIDAFNLINNAAAVASVDGQVNGASLSYAGRTADVATVLTAYGSAGFNGTSSGLTSGFSNINGLTGGDGTDSLQGLDVASTWIVSSSTSYTDDAAHTLTFSAYEILRGGSDIDTFDVSVASSMTLLGGAGIDAFNLTNDVAAVSSVDGEANGGTLSYTGRTADVATVLTAYGAAGFNGTSSGLTSGFANITGLAGGSGTDSLQGLDVASTWAVSSPMTYTDDAAHTLGFAAYETLQGGSAIDTFNVDIAASSVTLLGGAGVDAFNLTNDIAAVASIDGQVDGGSLSYAGRTVDVATVLTAYGTDGFNGTSSGLTSGFANINGLTGGSGTDSLQGLDVVSTWAISTSMTYTDDAAHTLGFSAYETLQGGSDIDTFNVDVAASSVSLLGGAGIDAFNLTNDVAAVASVDGQVDGASLSYTGRSAAVTAVLTAYGTDGFNGTSSGLTSGFANIIGLAGGSGSDSLQGMDVVSNWGIGGSMTYTDDASHTLSFIAFETLQGGSDIDTFNVAVAASSMTLLGGAGLDAFKLINNAAAVKSVDGQVDGGTLSYAGRSVDVATVLTAYGTDGFNGTSSGLTSGFSNINGLTGGSGSDSLQGLDVASTWAVAGSMTYTDNAAHTLGFAAYETLQGGSDIDTFNVSVASSMTLLGGAGVDAFNLTNDVAAVSSVDGEANGGSLSYAGRTADVATVLTAYGAAGFNGTSSGLTSGFQNINGLTGGSGTDSLQGLDVASTWGIGGSMTYTDDAAHTLGFAAYETLQGGSDVDTFNVSVASSMTLLGGGGLDAFNLTNNVAAVSSVDGEANGGSLSYAGRSAAVTTVLTAYGAAGFNGTSSGLTSGFANINGLTGGSGTDSLQGLDVASTWVIGGSTSYTDDAAHTLGFSAYETLQGGSDVDTFNVSVASSMTLLGGAGIDAFNLTNDVAAANSVDGQVDGGSLSYTGRSAAVATVLTVYGSAGFNGTSSGLTSGFQNINGLTGGSGTDSLQGLDVASTWAVSGSMTYTDDAAHTLGFIAYETLQGGSDVDTFNIGSTVATRLDLKGGAGDDSFVFGANGVSINGTIDGQGGTSNSLVYTAYTTTAVTVNLGTSMATGTKGIQSIQSLAGGTTTTLVGPNAVTTWTIDGANGGHLSSGFTFTSVKNLSGGVLTNTFALSGGSLTGTITGGSTNDTLTLAGSGAGASVLITGSNAGTVQTGGPTTSFTRIANIIGSTLDDTFTLAPGKGLTGTLTGGGGVDTLDYSNYTTAVRVNLTAGSATNIKSGATGGIVGIANVNGGSAADILIGNASANILNGNGGDDIISGCGGGDTIHGGDGNDIIITGGGGTGVNAYGDAGSNLMLGGSYTQQTNLTALSALMAEWGRTDVSLDTKVAHLSGAAGGRNGSYYLNAATVATDDAVEALYGGDGTTSSHKNWFIVGTANQAKDYDHALGDRMTIIPPV